MRRFNQQGGPPTERDCADGSVGDDVLSGLTGRLGSDTLRYIPAVIVPAVVSILFISIFTRVFDPGPYGEYALVFVIVAILTSAISGWLQQSVLRYLPRYRENTVERRFARNAWFWTIKTTPTAIQTTAGA